MAGDPDTRTDPTADSRGARELALVVGVTLLVQGVVVYTYEWARVGAGFYPLTLALRTLVPAIVAFGVLRMTPRALGLGPPRVGRRAALWLVGAAALIPVVAWPLLDLDGYHASYDGARHAFGRSGSGGTTFALFMLSTTLPWEIIHRGFLLHAARFVLVRAGVGATLAAAIAILLCQSFETLFHFVKPHPLEAMAIGVASPLLSWLALRTGSIWIPAAAHLVVEGAFYAAVLR